MIKPGLNYEIDFKDKYQILADYQWFTSDVNIEVAPISHFSIATMQTMKFVKIQGKLLHASNFADHKKDTQHLFGGDGRIKA